MRKVITMVLYNRPQYTKIVLDALKRCAGIGEYLLLPRIEPGNEEVIGLVSAIDFAEVQPTINPECYGGGRNTFLAWEAGFNVTDFIIHIEDDTVPASDCLQLMEHCCAAYKDDPRIFSVASYNRYPCPPEHYYGISSRGAYTCWLVGIWKDRWLWAKEDWSPEARRYATYLANRVVKKGLREVYPLLSRSQNIGIENGIHVHNARWHHVYHHTEYWAGNYSLSPQPFKEVHNPLVTAVMITGMHPDRHRTARIAIDCFRNQSYVHKELLIINHGDQGLDQHDDERIREIMIKKKPEQTIGDLRNLGLQHAKGDLIISWDDDDWHGPDRIAVQVAAQHGNVAVLLKRQIRFNVLNGSGFCISDEKGISDTILHPRLPHLKYENVLRGEDRIFLQCFGEVAVVDNDPLLHIRTYDGLNLWDADHTMQNYANMNLYNRLDVDATIKPNVQKIISQYIPRWAMDMRLKNVPSFSREML